jgi:hypothetical protein
MKRFLRFASVTVLAALVSGLLFGQNNPAVGAWKLNLAKSKPSTAPLAKSETRTVEAQGDGLKVSYDGINAEGLSFFYRYMATFDGKVNAITGSGQQWRDEQVNGADTIACKRIDTNTYEGTLKKAGKAVLTVTYTVSQDGKVTTLTVKGSDAKGQPTTEVSVWDKQ